MDRIQKIQYNSVLIQRQISLDKDLTKVNLELKKEQSECEHLNVILGRDDKYEYKKCLFCEKMVSNGTDLPTLDATSYKKELYGTGTIQEDRIRRLNDLKNEAISILKSNPQITNENLCKELEIKVKRK